MFLYFQCVEEQLDDCNQHDQASSIKKLEAERDDLETTRIKLDSTLTDEKQKHKDLVML
jgi:hypothetical protein